MLDFAIMMLLDLKTPKTTLKTLKTQKSYLMESVTLYLTILFHQKQQL